MAANRQFHPALMQGLYLVMSLLVVMIHLIPFGYGNRAWFSADWLMIITFAWTLRRPDHLPLYLIALVFLFADFIFQRPPGLFAALVVVANEFLRRRIVNLQTQTILTEWAVILILFIGIWITYRMILAVFFLPTLPFGISLLQTGLTVLIYPFFAVLFEYILGLRKLDMRDTKS